MAHQRTTIEKLARMIHEGFNGTASKEDLQGLATKEDLQELREEMNERFETVDTRLDHLDARVGRIEADVHALRDEMVHRREFEDVLDRVKYIEKKLGIESGV
jgi:predicted  nucleic acid-binding Zn-ribbon protein